MYLRKETTTGKNQNSLINFLEYLNNLNFKVAKIKN